MSAVLVAVALRCVDPRAAVHPLTGEVRAEAYAAGAGPADLCALEHALRIAEAFGGRCLAVTVGSVDAEGVLRDALAAGAHEALRVEGPDEDSAATARTLHTALAERGPLPDVVVCGDRSADRGTGATPAHLAGLLGASQALGLVELTPVDGHLKALRRLDGGRREVLSVPLPAVCSVERDTTTVRRAPLPAVLSSRTAHIDLATVAARGREGTPVRTGRPRPYRPRARVLTPPEGDTPRARLLTLTGAHTTPRTPPRLLTPDTAAQAAEALLAFVRAEKSGDEG
ncbi:mycofactocin-associated electron transfer flavoprotein beta subunit [Streptomyces monticola]|uniref:Mycofactocin-associated electron transfer flavoprotein beta subunit n=1 Tax=Streptomyces monticola TaxID=2666263 RepID=A0ABW2JY72_9ACTN